jgi:signal transduction histidine kinase
VQRARVELNGVVQEVAQLSQLLLGPNVSLVLQLEPLGAPVHIEQGEMEQVLLNLLLNARDAMPGGGTIVVSTARLRYSETSAPAGCKLRGAVVRLRVEDTGTGIDETIRDRIFEPFFTTKSPERGTGLGLASVAAMVKEAAGCVEIASRLGAGTTVDVLLPDADSVGQCAA